MSWTNDELQILREKSATFSDQQLAELLPKRTQNAIQWKRRQLGIHRSPGVINDLTGQVFGRWKVCAFAGIRNGGHAFWVCQCSCPEQTIRFIDGVSLRRGHSKSCGCGNNVGNFRHGGNRKNGRKTVEYVAWSSMFDRCYNPNHKYWKHYGGRGITVCERWKGHNGYINFLTDMGLRPSTKHSLNRMDNDGDYEPGNCEWATRREQANNRRSNHYITIGNETLTITQWSRRAGIRWANNASKKLKNGTPPEVVFAAALEVETPSPSIVPEVTSENVLNLWYDEDNSTEVA